MRTLVADAPAGQVEAVRRRAVDMIVAATVALVAVVAIVGVSHDSASGPLSWTGDAQVFPHPTIPGDRVLSGKLENASDRTLRVDIGDVRLVTSGGEVVPSNPVFLQTFGKSLWAGGRGPQEVPDSELQRTGRIVLLSPGEDVPITIAWHDDDGTPARVEYEQGSLTVPG